jgi:hypothetical protein
MIERDEFSVELPADAIEALAHKTVHWTVFSPNPAIMVFRLSFIRHHPQLPAQPSYL